MKKIISALMCMGILAAALTGCGYNDALENSNKKANCLKKQFAFGFLYSAICRKSAVNRDNYAVYEA